MNKYLVYYGSKKNLKLCYSWEEAIKECTYGEGLRIYHKDNVRPSKYIDLSKLRLAVRMSYGIHGLRNS